MNEAQVVKRSLSAFISLTGFMALLMGLGFLYLLALKNALSPYSYLWLCEAVFAAVTLAAYRWLETSGAAKFSEL
jgi:hypothetical protein